MDNLGDIKSEHDGVLFAPSLFKPMTKDLLAPISLRKKGDGYESIVRRRSLPVKTDSGGQVD